MAFIFLIFCVLSRSYPYEYLDKKGKLTGLTKQDKKRRFCNSYSYLQSRVLFAPPGRRASRHKRYLLNQRGSYFRWYSSVPVCTLFSRLPQA